MSLVSKLAITSSTLQKICTAALCAPLLESLCIRNTVVINDTDVSILIDWLPMLLRFLESSESHSIDPQGAGGRIKKLTINNCKLIPTMYYTSMQFPLGIVELDFSCNPDLGLSGVAYILAAIKDKQFTRRIVFSRCTLESAAGAACDSHLAILVQCFPQFKSLELVDLSFNFFNISQLLQIITALPACISTLQLCGLEFLNDFNGFASALKAGFGHLGPCLRTVLLSHNATLVSLPTTMSVCENISYLDVSFCSNLKYIPDELFVPALSVLIAHNNPSLEYVGLLPGKSLNLSFVDLSSCTSLQTLPDEIYVATLEVLLLCHNTALKNIAKVGTGIVNAVRLRCIDLTNCTQLSSLPDQLASDCLSNLDSIIIKGCSSMVYPPSNSVKKTQHIKDYLKSAKDQPPLKRVKVVLLGNGRSGKTSLLGALAKRELDVECPSTKGVQVDMFAKKLQPQSSRKSFAKFVGASLSKFAPEVTCAPSHPALCSFDHMTRYWDFAGQLEYSATHDFFMSSRQAVYVIVFSVADHASSQADQVRYWLNTILARHSMHNRIMVVGTKIDVIDTQLVVTDERDLPRLREAALKRHEKMMRQCVDSVTCNYNISFTIPILFTTADKKHPLWRQKRKNVKSQISQFSQDIFDFCEGQLRFPAIHKALFYEVQELAKQHPHKPVFSLDDPCITPKSKLLYALRGSPDGRSLQSLDILSDVGLLVHYNCKGQDYICPTPQYVANLVSLLAGACHCARHLRF
jgi:GTPase SAR1 family protein